MGLFKRKTVWWMRFTYKGRQFRRSTETTNKKLAEKIHHKVMTQIAEGKWFERLEGEDKTIGDLLEKYIIGYSIPNKAPSTVRSDIGLSKEMKKFFGDTALSDVTPRLLTEYRSMCREKGLFHLLSINAVRCCVTPSSLLYGNGNGLKRIPLTV